MKRRSSLVDGCSCSEYSSLSEYDVSSRVVNTYTSQTDYINEIHLDRIFVHISVPMRSHTFDESENSPPTSVWYSSVCRLNELLSIHAVIEKNGGRPTVRCRDTSTIVWLRFSQYIQSTSSLNRLISNASRLPCERYEIPAKTAFLFGFVSFGRSSIAGLDGLISFIHHTFIMDLVI